MKLDRSVGNVFRSAVLGFSVALMPLAAEAGEKITYTFKDYKGQVKGTKTIDTDVFWIEDGALWLTAETMVAIDVNSQKLENVYTRAQIEAEKDAVKRNKMLTDNLILYVLHLADAHQDSVKQYAVLVSKAIAQSAVDKFKKTDEYQKLGTDQERISEMKRVFAEAARTEYARQDRKYTQKFGKDWEKIPFPTSLADINELAKDALDME
jgi:hypothetical protein